MSFFCLSEDRLHSSTPINLHVNPGHKTRLIRCKEQARRSNIRRLAKPPERYVRQEIQPVLWRVRHSGKRLEPDRSISATLFQDVLVLRDKNSQSGPSQQRTNRVHPYLVRSKLRCQPFCCLSRHVQSSILILAPPMGRWPSTHIPNGPFTSIIPHQPRPRPRRSHTRHINHTPTPSLLHQQGQDSGSAEINPLDIDVETFIEIRFRDVQCRLLHPVISCTDSHYCPV